MNTFLKFIFILILVAIVILFCALLFEKSLTEETLEIKVAKIEKMVSEDGDLYYLVHTKHEVFENRNHYFHNKSNMREINSRLKPKGKYNIKVVGFNFGEKIPFFLEHRNILDIVDKKLFIQETPEK